MSEQHERFCEVKLRTRTLLITAFAAFGLVMALYIPIRWQIERSYAALEQEVTAKDLARARHAVEANLASMMALARDYAVWDEIWRFIGPEGEPDFVTRNLMPVTFTQNRLDLFAIRDEARAIPFALAFDRKAGVFVSSPELLGDLGSLLGNLRDEGGLIRTPRGPMLIGLHPILRSSGDGPRRGFLLMGRLLDRDEITKLANEHELSLSIEIWQDTDAPSLNPTQRTHTQPITNDTQLEAKALLLDAQDAPFLVLRLVLARDVWMRGQQSATWLLWALLIAGAALGMGVAVLVEKLVTARLAQLSQDVSRVSANPDHSLRVRTQGRDELGLLSDDINKMLASLEKLNVALEHERGRSESLLLNILPPNIADRLKSGERVIADQFTEASVLFADIVGFTNLAAKVKPSDLVSMLGDIFTNFDALAKRHGVEKIKTIGDAYMAVCGLPNPRLDHAQVLVDMAVDMLATIDDFNRARHTNLSIRVGINSGPVVAGVIGSQKFIYDLWGDAVNVASRMESSGLPGCIQLTEQTFKALTRPPPAQSRTVEIKGKGIMSTWIIRPQRAQTLPDEAVVIGLP